MKSQRLQLNSLITRARIAAKFRGHTLKKFSRHNPGLNGGGSAESYCIKCKAWIQVETNPAPNSIDVGGTAVAISCK